MECERCQQPLIKVDRYGEQLIGCIDCNCWRGTRSAFVMDLSVEEIQALQDWSANAFSSTTKCGALEGDIE